MRLVKHLGIMMVFLCALPFAALAQQGGSIDGTVTDPNGAVVAEAKVTATNVTTGVQTNVDTSQSGIYVFPLLLPGPYTITVTQTGFKTVVREGIEVRLALNETIDIKLELGAVQQRVEVQGQAPVLELNNSTLGVNMSPQTLDELPVWFGGSIRLANSFMGYMPSVQSVPTSQGQTTINGSMGRATEVMIDGGSIISPESGGISFYFPGMEPYAETKIITSGPTAEFGRSGGGWEMFTTKSGSNAVHGSMFYNFERDIFNAVPFQTNASENQSHINSPCIRVTQQACRPKTRYNDEGGSAGGPIYIPHVYDGRNKSFFFFTWEGYWQPASVSVQAGETIPTAAEVAGNFAGLAPIYDPATTGLGGNAPGVRSQFAGNVIPASRFSTISKNIIANIPTPNAALGSVNPVGDYSFNETTVITDKDWSLKVDHTIHQNHHLAFFFTHRFEPSNVIQNMNGPLSDGLLSTTNPHQFRGTWDWVVSPHFVAHSYWSGDFDNQEWNNPQQNGFGCKLGFTELPCGTNADATPQIIFQTNSYLEFGMNQGKVNNGGQRNRIMMEGSNFTWVRGKHEFKFGGEVRRMQTLNNDWSTTNGVYYFNQGQTEISNGVASTGDSFASLLLGDVNQASQGGLPIFDANIRYAYTAGFFQDTWKMTPKLTLSLGMRYEVPIGWHYTNGTYSSFSPTAPNPAAGNLPGAMIFMGNGPGHTGTLRPYPTDFSDLGPRFGFAYRAMSNTVVRGGFGILYEGLSNGECGCTDGYGGGTFSDNPQDNFTPNFMWDKNPNGTPGAFAPAGFAGAQQIPGVDNFGSGGQYEAAGTGPSILGPKYGTAPRIYDFNFTIEHQYKGWLFQVAYVGQRTHGAETNDAVNTVSDKYLSLENTPTAMVTSAGTVPAGTNLLTWSFNNPMQAGILNALGYYSPSGAGSLNPTCAGWTTCWTNGWAGSAASLAQSLKPYPQMGPVYSANDGNGWLAYDSLQIKVEHRFGDLNFESSFVHSKNLSNDAFIQIFGLYNLYEGQQDPANYSDGKTFANSDMPNFLNFTASYQLPFGRGKKFMGSAHGWVNDVVGGWTVAGVGQYRSGSLLPIMSPVSYLNQEMGWEITKATTLGGAIKSGQAANTLDPNNPASHWLSNNGCTANCTSYSTAYGQTPLGAVGNQSIYNTNFRNPWFRNENLSANKMIGLWDEGKVSLRLTVYAANPFQRTDFYVASGTLSSSNFGRPAGPLDGARQLSMGLRLYF